MGARNRKPRRPENCARVSSKSFCVAKNAPGRRPKSSKSSSPLEISGSSSTFWRASGIFDSEDEDEDEEEEEEEEEEEGGDEDEEEDEDEDEDEDAIEEVGRDSEEESDDDDDDDDDIRKKFADGNGGGCGGKEVLLVAVVVGSGCMGGNEGGKMEDSEFDWSGNVS